MNAPVYLVCFSSRSASIWAHNKTKIMCSVQLPLQRPQHHAGHQTRQTQILPRTRSMIGQAVAFDNAYLNRNVPYSSIALEEFLNVPVRKSRLIHIYESCSTKITVLCSKKNIFFLLAC